MSDRTRAVCFDFEENAFDKHLQAFDRESNCAGLEEALLDAYGTLDLGHGMSDKWAATPFYTTTEFHYRSLAAHFEDDPEKVETPKEPGAKRARTAGSPLTAEKVARVPFKPDAPPAAKSAAPAAQPVVDAGQDWTSEGVCSANARSAAARHGPAAPLAGSPAEEEMAKAIELMLDMKKAMSQAGFNLWTERTEARDSINQNERFTAKEILDEIIASQSPDAVSVLRRHCHLISVGADFMTQRSYAKRWPGKVIPVGADDKLATRWPGKVDTTLPPRWTRFSENNMLCVTWNGKTFFFSPAKSCKKWNFLGMTQPTVLPRGSLPPSNLEYWAQQAAAEEGGAAA